MGGSASKAEEPDQQTGEEKDDVKAATHGPEGSTVGEEEPVDHEEPSSDDKGKVEEKKERTMEESFAVLSLGSSDKSNDSCSGEAVLEGETLDAEITSEDKRLNEKANQEPQMDNADEEAVQKSRKYKDQLTDAKVEVSKGSHITGQSEDNPTQEEANTEIVQETREKAEESIPKESQIQEGSVKEKSNMDNVVTLDDAVSCVAAVSSGNSETEKQPVVKESRSECPQAPVEESIQPQDDTMHTEKNTVLSPSRSKSPKDTEIEVLEQKNTTGEELLAEHADYNVTKNSSESPCRTPELSAIHGDETPELSALDEADQSYTSASSSGSDDIDFAGASPCKRIPSTGTGEMEMENEQKRPKRDITSFLDEQCFHTNLEPVLETSDEDRHNLSDHITTCFQSLTSGMEVPPFMGTTAEENNLRLRYPTSGEDSDIEIIDQSCELSMDQYSPEREDTPKKNGTCARTMNPIGFIKASKLLHKDVSPDLCPKDTSGTYLASDTSQIVKGIREILKLDDANSPELDPMSMPARKQTEGKQKDDIQNGNAEEHAKAPTQEEALARLQDAIKCRQAVENVTGVIARGHKRKTTAKAREKKQQRKLESARLKAAQAVVDAANELPDPLGPLAPFKKFDRNGLNLEISCNRVKDMDDDTINWAFHLTKENMQTLYEQSDWGWNDEQKKEEMSEDAARYLIARDVESREPVALVHFRFDIDEGDEVLYCYEIQLIKEVRRKGLGKFLMQILELMAFKTHMKKVMLTVFKHNPDAQAFFKNKLKYEVDETSPEETMVEQMFDEEGEGYTYQIISKVIGQKKVTGASSSTAANGHSHTVQASA